jgi:hypothetical protein
LFAVTKDALITAAWPGLADWTTSLGTSQKMKAELQQFLTSNEQSR